MEQRALAQYDGAWHRLYLAARGVQGARRLSPWVEAVAVAAVWTVELPREDLRMRWRVRLEKQAGEMVEKCYFPYLNGIWLGDDWTRDELYMPVHAGDRTVNPTATLSAQPHSVSWKWQEYQYTFTLGGPYGAVSYTHLKKPSCSMCGCRP